MGTVQYMIACQSLKVIPEAIFDVWRCHAWELSSPSPKGTIVAIAGHPEMPAYNVTGASDMPCIQLAQCQSSRSESQQE